ncbi:MAG: TauD/TfdA family dioxygenase [Pseudomonadales bacterium]
MSASLAHASIASTSHSCSAPPSVKPSALEIEASLKDVGWIHIPGSCTSIEGFSDTLRSLVVSVTFDPAREYADGSTQKVSAGREAIGYHIENGNTPLPPDIVAFYCATAAKWGSQTIVCDGAQLWAAMSAQTKRCFREPITVQRNLEAPLWKRYVATALHRKSPSDVSYADLYGFLTSIPGQRGRLIDNEMLEYSLTLPAIRDDNVDGVPAFANALLGPSFNYETPEYTFANGRQISNEIIAELTELGERFTHEISWSSGDLVIIDNKRVMHGRHKIIGPLSDRQLYIGMGMRG